MFKTMASLEKTSSSKTLPIFSVDAFSDVPFHGNQAGVCPLPPDVHLEDETLQKIAAEMNISETAFVKMISPSQDFTSGDRFGLRWFTPITEVKLCGHATLATAAVLFKKFNNPSASLTFETLSGNLVVSHDGDDLVMDFATGVTQKQEMEGYEKLIQTLFPEPKVVEELEFCSSLRYLIIRIKDGWTRREFEEWSPSLKWVEASVPPGQLVGVIVTCSGSPQAGFCDSNQTHYDFLSRFFAPWVGIPEDPVTGSAHTVLPYFWGPRLGKTEMYGRQCSKRGGDVSMSLNGDRVLIRGKATFVIEGNLII